MIPVGAAGKVEWWKRVVIELDGWMICTGGKLAGKPAQRIEFKLQERGLHMVAAKDKQVKNK